MEECKMPPAVIYPNVDTTINTLLFWPRPPGSFRRRDTLAWTELLDVCAVVLCDTPFDYPGQEKVCTQLLAGPDGVLFISLVIHDDAPEVSMDVLSEDGESVTACPAASPGEEGSEGSRSTVHYNLSHPSAFHLVFRTNAASREDWTVVDTALNRTEARLIWKWTYTFHAAGEGGVVASGRVQAFLRWLTMMLAQVSFGVILKSSKLDVGLRFHMGSLFATGKTVKLATGSALQDESRLLLGTVKLATVTRALREQSEVAIPYTCILSTLLGYDAEGTNAVVLAFVFAPPKESEEAHGHLPEGVPPAFSFLAFRAGHPDGGFQKDVSLVGPGLPPGALAHPFHAWETTSEEVLKLLTQSVDGQGANNVETSIQPPGDAWGFYDAQADRQNTVLERGQRNALAHLQNTMLKGGQSLPSTSARLRNAAARRWRNASAHQRAGLAALAAGGIGASALAYQKLMAHSGRRSQLAAERRANWRPTAARKLSSA